MRKFYLILVCVLLSLTGKAQNDFTQLNWNELRIDSVLPVYSEVVPLETDYRLFQYSVRVCYPEWAPLTAAETAVAERFKEQISDSLVIDTYVGVSRGQGLLDISFIPIVTRGGHYEKLLSGKIEIIPHSINNRVKKVALKATPATSRWATQSVLSQGRWVKISVQEDGVYHLTSSALRDMGFSNPANCRVYGYGGHLQPELIDADNDFDDLEEVSLWSVPDGFLFYANGLSTHRDGKHIVNHYAREACYFVTEASTPVGAFPTVAATDAATTEVSTIQAYASYNPQEYAWFQGGRQLFESYDYANGNTRSYTLTLPCSPTNSKGQLTVNFSAANDVPTQVTTSFNGSSMGSISIPAITEYIYGVLSSRIYTVTPQAANTVRFTTTANNHARLNFFTLSYTGALAIDGTYSAIAFEHQPQQAKETLCLSYSNSQQPQIWRLAERGSQTVALQGTGSTSGEQPVYRATVENDGASHRYVALDVNAYNNYPQPTVVGEISNQNLHGLNNIEMVIITPASGIFDAEAERLAAAHREQEGLNVAVVRADQIYNEFSSGTPDATAYRRFMKMLYDRAAGGEKAPRYLLLFGDCAWDNRMLTSAWKKYSPNDFLLCFESENSVSDITCYVMEDYFGLLDDGEGQDLTREKTDLGVGRFPVRTVSEAQALVNKTIAYMRGDESGAWKNIVCFMGDDGDNNEHLKFADDVAQIIEKTYPQLEVRKVMWDAYQRQVTAAGNRYPQVQQVISKQMNEGALMMNYTGHGATYCLSHEMVLRLEDFANYKSPRAPLWVTAACDVMPFDTQKDNIGETAILNPNGAAVGFFGTARTVYAHLNLEINRYFSKLLFADDEFGRPNRVGDAVRLSKAQLAGNAIDVSENKLHYALLGDPALTFGSVKNRIVLESINGTKVEDLPTDFMIHAGSGVHLSGHVEDENGTQLNDFTGEMAFRLYDSRSTITCLNNANVSSGPFTYQAYDNMLYTGRDSVRNGRFELMCPVPIDIHYGDEAGRFVFYAVRSDRRSEARGYNEDFLLGSMEGGSVDKEGPQIVAYLNDEQFEDGQVVNCSPYFVAQLEDKNGINTSGSGLGHDLELMIDKNAATTYVLNDYYVSEFGDYTRGHLAFSIPSLSAGVHTLTFRAWDMLNNPATTSFTFEVDPTLKPSFLKLTTSSNPATVQTQFMLTYDRPGSSCNFTIEVFDFMGRLLWQHTETGSSDNGYYVIPWDLTKGNGAPVGSGVYLYRARISCDDSEEATKAQKLIINRKQ